MNEIALKLWEARSRLYGQLRQRPKAHFAAFFEIYKICIPLHLWNPRWKKPWKNHPENPLHRSDLKISAKTRESSKAVFSEFEQTVTFQDFQFYHLKIFGNMMKNDDI